jgi:Cu-Zn family superoxide dismutase
MGWASWRSTGLAALLFLIAVASATFGRVSAQPGLGFAEIRNADGRLVGAASFQRVQDGIEIRARFRGLPPGQHGYHVHAVGKCDPPAFMTAQGHFNPTLHEHGLENPFGAHVGDLPNLTISEDGTASLTAIAVGAMLASDETSLFDIDGSAVVIHADPDDNVTDPAGNSGARIACGVLSAGPAHGSDGRLFVNESPETQAVFREAWGDYAPEQWVLEHNDQIGA